MRRGAVRRGACFAWMASRQLKLATCPVPATSVRVPIREVGGGVGVSVGFILWGLRGWLRWVGVMR